MGLQKIYFRWMSELVLPNAPDREKYSYLLDALNRSTFYFDIPMDENRLQDGIDLRYRFAYLKGYSIELIDLSLCKGASCSMLEMMTALAVKGDESVLYDYETGSRVDYIFKTMITSLGFLSMTNDNFDERYIDIQIDRLLNRDYAYNGKGGLFTVNNPRRDMREVDIWYQMSWYLQTLYNK